MSRNANKNRKRSRESDGGHASKRPISNPLLDKQTEFLNSLTKSERDAFFSNKHVDPTRRGDLWMTQADLGEDLVNRYAWATPDERALRIIKHFSPIIEIGCGRGYWCSLMKKAGIDVVGYDINPDSGGKIPSRAQTTRDGPSPPTDSDSDSFLVRTGGPDILEKAENLGRTLFLCYPDEEEYVDNHKVDNDDVDRAMSLGAACLDSFRGEHIIHIGELYPDSLSMEQAPWGRSSSPEFQQRLAAEYHCLLRARLPSWLHVRDTLSVWKRSETTTIVFEAGADDDASDKDDEVEYRYVIGVVFDLYGTRQSLISLVLNLCPMQTYPRRRTPPCRLGCTMSCSSPGRERCPGQ